MLLRRYHKVISRSKEKVANSTLTQDTQPPFKEMSVKELRDLCKERGIKGYSNKSEEELIEMLSGGEKNVGTDK